MTGEPMLVAVERRGPVLLIRLGRPDAVNPLGPALLAELSAAVRDAQDEPGIRCVVFTGQGRSFGAGADLREVLNRSIEENLEYGRQLRRAFDEIAGCSVPTIAAINGYALGGGLELALACSIRIAAAGVALGLPEAGLGLIPAAGGVQRIIRTIPRGAALELMLTGKAINADRGLELGMVDRVVPLETLVEEALSVAMSIASNSPAAVQAIKWLVDRGAELPLAAAQDMTDDGSAQVLATMEWREGVAAFLERRPPEFAAASGGGR
jgi:enoyl-CoA hydratase